MNYNNLSLHSALSREFSKMGMTVKGLKSVRIKVADDKTAVHAYNEQNVITCWC